MSSPHQLAFDTTLTHLRKQGRKSTDDAGYCAYLTEDGLMCAIGALLAPGKYSREMEGKTVLAVTVFDAIDPKYRDGNDNENDHNFFIYLQKRLHDRLSNDYFLADLEAAAERFANKEGLTYVRD